MTLLDAFNTICEDLEQGRWQPLPRDAEAPEELPIEEEAVTFMIAKWMKQRGDKRYKDLCPYILIPDCAKNIDLSGFSLKELAHFTCPETKKG